MLGPYVVVRVGTFTNIQICSVAFWISQPVFVFTTKFVLLIT